MSVRHGQARLHKQPDGRACFQAGIPNRQLIRISDGNVLDSHLLLQEPGRRFRV